jgi:hypothetical protein
MKNKIENKITDKSRLDYLLKEGVVSDYRLDKKMGLFIVCIGGEAIYYSPKTIKKMYEEVKSSC